MDCSKRSTRWLALLLCLAMLLSFTACSGGAITTSETPVPSSTVETTLSAASPSADAATRVVVDGEGNSITIPEKVTRVAASGRFIQETIMLGGGDTLVVQADIESNQSSDMLYSVYPALKELPIVFAKEVSVEELIKADPDVVITKAGEDAEAIAALGIPTVGIKSGDTPKDEVTLIAQVLGGDAVTIAEKYNEFYDQTFDAVAKTTSAIPQGQRPKVYVAGGNDGTDLLHTEAKNDIITKWIEAAGGTNVATDETAEINGKQFSIESVIKWDPDVIIVTSAAGKKLLETEPQWQGITAVKNGSIYVCPMGLYLWSVRSAEGVLMPLWAGQTLHPELFGDLDMMKVVKDFYNTYYHYALTDKAAQEILNPVD